MDTSSVPRKQCSRKDQCIHPESDHGWLPATSVYFHKNKQALLGLHSVCVACKNLDTRAHYHRPDIQSTRDQQVKAYRQTETGRKNRNRSDAKRRATHPEKFRARGAILNAKRNGLIPPATALSCVHCGNPAEQYHHFLGYAKEHYLDVIPLCRNCHRIAEREIN